MWLPNRSRPLNQPPTTSTPTASPASACPGCRPAPSRATARLQHHATRSTTRCCAPQIQTPSPSAACVIAQTLYDERGLAVTAQADIWDQRPPPVGHLVADRRRRSHRCRPRPSTTAPAAPITAVTKSHERHPLDHDTTYTGDTVTTTAPTAARPPPWSPTPSARPPNAASTAAPQPHRQRLHHRPRSPTRPAGQQETVTGPDQAKWSYGYDLFGRQTSATDPDKGTSTTGYNDLDQAVSTTDARRSKTLLTEYDVLGRKTGLWDGTKTDATKLAAWTFDTLAKGQQDTAVRYDGRRQAHRQGLHPEGHRLRHLYQVTGSQLILPDRRPAGRRRRPADPVVLQPATTSTAPSGTATQPAVGGLASEIVAYDYDYNGVGLQQPRTGTTGYHARCHVLPTRRPRQLTLGTDTRHSAKKAYLNYDYEDGHPPPDAAPSSPTTPRLHAAGPDLHPGRRRQRHLDLRHHAPWAAPARPTTSASPTTATAA